MLKSERVLIRGGVQMRLFKVGVLVLAVFFGVSLVSGARAIAEETAAPAATTAAAPAEKADKTEKKHHKNKPGVKKLPAPRTAA